MRIVLRRLLIDVIVVVVLGGLIWKVAEHLSRSKSAVSPDWLAAVATWAALVAAVLAGIYAARAFSLEVKREQDRDDAQKRSQAEQVAGWYEEPIQVMISNRSGLPVFDVTVGLHLPAPVELEDVPMPTSWTSIHRSHPPLPLLIPRDSAVDLSGSLDLESTNVLAAWRARASAAPMDVDTGWPMVELEFRDAAGQRWVRTGNGELKPTTRPGAD